jgi:hypothetical protein
MEMTIERRKKGRGDLYIAIIMGKRKAAVREARET